MVVKELFKTSMGSMGKYSSQISRAMGVVGNAKNHKEQLLIPLTIWRNEGEYTTA